MKCPDPECGVEVGEEDRFCEECGTALAREERKQAILYVLLGGHCCILLLLLSDLFTIFYNWEHNVEVLIFLLILILVSIISSIIIYKIFKYNEISEILSYTNIVLLSFLVLSLVFFGKVTLLPTTLEFKPSGWGPFIFVLILSGPSVANLIVKKIIRGREKSPHLRIDPDLK